MSSALSERVTIAPDASNLAFAVGQIAERVLLDRSCDLAAGAGSAIATDEDVRTSFDSKFLDDLFDAVRQSWQRNEAGDESSRRSREAA
jgi:hypothetical protein